MALNKNHEFEELDGVKCGIVEKNVLPERVEFLKKILEYNNYAGQGITTKATAEVTRFGFEALGMRSIVIKAAVDNTGSNKIAQKLGYELSGTEKSDNGTTINVWRKTNE